METQLVIELRLTGWIKFASKSHILLRKHLKMTTYYSDYTELDLNVYHSPQTELDINHYISDYGTLDIKHYTSDWAVIAIHINTPGGVLAWTKISPNSSSTNAIRLHQTVEGTIPSGSLTSKINPDPEFIFQNIMGQDVFTQDFKSPSIYFNNVEDPRVMSITNEILSFVYGDGKFNEEKHKLQTQYVPKKIVAGRKTNGKIAGYCYFNDNNIYAFEFNDEADFSSSSSSNSSSITNSFSSQSSSSSTQKKLSSQSSPSSTSSATSGSSSSHSSSTSSTSGSSSSHVTSQSSSSSSSLSLSSSKSTRSSGSSSTKSSQFI